MSAMDTNSSPTDVDEAAVLDLFAQVLDGWSCGSGEAFAAPFAEMVDFIAFDGTHLSSQAQVEKVHQQLFDKWLRGTQLTGEATVRFLSSDVALIIARSRTVMRGKRKPAPERDSIQTLTAVRDGDRWRLSSFQNTRIRPMGATVRGTFHWLVGDTLWKFIVRPKSEPRLEGEGHAG